MTPKERIEAANQKAGEILTGGRPKWVDVAPAIDVIPGMTEKTVLIAGPPIAPENIPDAIRTAICGAIQYEGLADSKEAAWALVVSGDVSVEPAQDHDTACGAAMALSAHMDVLVCEDTVYGGRGFCAPHPGPGSHVLRWGVYDEKVQADLEYFRDHYCPALRRILARTGGFDLVEILSKTAGMGDENHNRQTASTMYLALRMIRALAEDDFADRDDTIVLLCDNERFFLHVMMAGAEAVLASVKQIPDSTVMVSMGGNGVEFGVQFAGLPHQWFTAEAPIIRGLFLKPTYTDADMLGFLGDSCVTEVYGLGGMSAIAGPGYVMLSGGTFEDGIQRTEDARTVSVAEHTFAPVPWCHNCGFPAGVDLRRVVATGVLPTSHGGGTLKAGGQGTMGFAKLPMECFVKGLRAFTEKMKEA